jgi:hypothetical protein
MSIDTVKSGSRAESPTCTPTTGSSRMPAPATRSPRRSTSLNAELIARFERDAIPLRAPLHRRALRMTPISVVSLLMTVADRQLRTRPGPGQGLD